jgi:hypothetical protein
METLYVILEARTEFLGVSTKRRLLVEVAYDDLDMSNGMKSQPADESL